MIQRIQSILLLLAGVAVALMFFFPVASFYGNESYFSFGITGVSDAALVAITTWPLQATAILLTVLSLLSIFLFKNRMAQYRVVRFALLVDLGFIIMMYFGYIDVIVKKANVSAQFEAGTYFPLVAIVLLLLAARAILSDEKKVKAADRLR